MTATATTHAGHAPTSRPRGQTPAQRRATRRYSLESALPWLAELAWLHRVVGHDHITKIHWAHVCPRDSTPAAVERCWLRTLSRARALGLRYETEQVQVAAQGATAWLVGVRPLWTILDVEAIAEREGGR